MSTGKEIGKITVDYDSHRGKYYNSAMWAIHYSSYVSMLLQNNNHYYSPSFGLADVPWRLEIRPNAERQNKHWLGLYVWKECTGSGISKTVDFTLGTQNSDGTVNNSWTGRQQVQDNGIRFGVPKFLRRLSRNHQTTVRKSSFKFEPNKGLTIFCVINECRQDIAEGDESGSNEVQANPVPIGFEGSSSEDEESEEENEALNDPKGIYTFCQDMKDFLLSGRLCDVTILIKDEELRAHKTVLAARSPVFSAMFEHEMEEKKTGLLEISDCSLEVFKEFLHYLYTGKVQEISLKHVCGVYVLADKYDVKQLKEECIAIMKKGISLDNFCDVISLAIKYKESKLLKRARKYFIENAKSILQSVHWQSFIAEAPTVANELFLKTLSQ